MSFSLVIHHEAYRELDEAERFLEDRRTGLGQLFRAEVGNSLAFIQDRPYGYAERSSGYRYGIVAKFPYRVIYMVYGTVIFVAAVYHGKRRPQGWRQRLL